MNVSKINKYESVSQNRVRAILKLRKRLKVLVQNCNLGLEGDKPAYSQIIRKAPTH